MASLKELSFTQIALIAASLANQSAAFKNVVSKGVMKKPWAKGLGPQNTYAVVNILALLATLPFVAFFDAKDFVPVFDAVTAAGKGADVAKYSLLSGLAFYIYNEASFLCLSRLSPSPLRGEYIKARGDYYRLLHRVPYPHVSDWWYWVWHCRGWHSAVLSC